jgi:IS30 family transposase
MGKRYEQLKPEERATVMLMRQEGSSMRAVARQLQRSPSSISRELARHRGEGQCDDATAAGQRARARRFQQRRRRKLAPDTVLFGVVEHFLREGWSPEQIAGTLKNRYPEQAERRVSHETIYHALDVLPRGELRAGLLSCLRQGPACSIAPTKDRPANGKARGVRQHPTQWSHDTSVDQGHQRWG